MGQRSQIYIRYTDEKINKCYLTARNFSWNYGERMISRLRHTLEWIEERRREGMFWHFSTEPKKMIHILETNFNLKDVCFSMDIIKEYFELFQVDGEPFNDSVFYFQDCNDGKLLIDIKKESIKYAFLDCECNIDNVMTAFEYMSWDSEKDWKQYLSEEEGALCIQNMNAISKLAAVMSKEEVKQFFTYDYMADMKKPDISKNRIINELLTYLMENMHWCPFKDSAAIDFDKECVGFGEQGCRECINKHIGELNKKG